MRGISAASVEIEIDESRDRRSPPWRRCGSAFSRAAIFSAMARGLALRRPFAAASAPLHWNCARSGRSESLHLAEALRQSFRRERLRRRCATARPRARSWDVAARFLVVGDLRRRHLEARQHLIIRWAACHWQTCSVDVVRRLGDGGGGGARRRRRMFSMQNSLGQICWSPSLTTTK